MENKKIRDLKLNQRLVRVQWNDGVPYIQIGRISRLTGKSFYVSTNKGEITGKIGDWFQHWRSAILASVISLLSLPDFNPLIERLGRERYSAWAVVGVLCRLKRLYRKCQKRLGGI
jgi:hypothetical protein